MTRKETRKRALHGKQKDNEILKGGGEKENILDGSKVIRCEAVHTFRTYLEKWR